MGTQRKVQEIYTCDLTKQNVNKLMPQHRIRIMIEVEPGKWQWREFELCEDAHFLLVSRLLEEDEDGIDSIGEDIEEDLVAKYADVDFDDDADFFQVSEEDDISFITKRDIDAPVEQDVDPANFVDLSEEDDSIVRADGSVIEGKVLKRIKAAAAARRHSRRARCSDCLVNDHNNGICDYEDGICTKCRLPPADGNESSTAHNPLEAKGEGYDNVTGAHTFPIDVNNPVVQKKLRQHAARLNSKIQSEAKKAGRHVRVTPDVKI
jgi:hypothetical protein